MLSCVQLIKTPQTTACQTLLFMEFPWQEYWSGLPYPPPGYFPEPGIKPVSLVSCIGRFPTEPSGKALLQLLSCSVVSNSLQPWSFLVAQTVKRLPTMPETRVRFLGWEVPLDKEMATHSSILARKIPRTEEPGRLQSMGSQRVRHDSATSFSLFTFLRWRRKRQPAPVFLPGESQGKGSLVGCRL